MIKKSQRIQPVVDLAHHDEKDAVKELAAALKALNNNSERLQQLEGYQLEYMERFRTAGQAGISGSRINDFRAFLTKIKAAIEAQREVVESSKRYLEQKKRFWFAKRGRSRALDAVLEKYMADERVIQAKREQRELDDRPLRVDQD